MRPLLLSLHSSNHRAIARAQWLIHNARCSLACSFCSLRGRLFDVLHGTDTVGTREIADLAIDEEARDAARKYRATKIGLFNHIMQNLNIPRSDFTFIDMGSGKGLCLMLAARYGFKHLIGIEICPALTAVAERNIAIFRRTSRSRAAFLLCCADARNYEIPNVRALFYLYNPFNINVMRVFLANVERSLEQFPREIMIVYVVPSAMAALEESAFLVLKSEGSFRGDRFLVYSNAVSSQA